MAHKINKQFAAKIRRVRKIKKISQEELAAKIAVQTATISNIERGKTDTSVYTIFKIAKVFKVYVRELFTFR